MPSLVVTFVSAGALFILLQAEFIAMVLIVVYVGSSFVPYVGAGVGIAEVTFEGDQKIKSYPIALQGKIGHFLPLKASSKVTARSNLKSEPLSFNCCLFFHSFGDSPFF